MLETEKSFCLSREEIREFTRAYTRARQLSFLRLNGIRHYVDANGWPVVTRSAVEGESSLEQPAAPKWQPNKAKDL